MRSGVLLVFSGLPGTGKSTLAQAVGRRLGIPVLSVDPIEHAILRAGIAMGHATGLAAYLVVEAIADAQLTLGQSAIVDAVNAVEMAKVMWRDLAARHGAPLRIVECFCADQALHRERLRGRQRGLPGFPEPTWEEVQRRQLERTPWVEPVLRIDAGDSFEANVDRVLEWLERSG